MWQRDAVPSESATSDRAGALAGVRVLDLATERAGSVATMLLADLGADVVRPETQPGTHRRPSPTDDVAAVCWDRGKRRFVIDALDPSRDDAMARLVDAADVIVVDAGPTRLHELGLQPDALAE